AADLAGVGRRLGGLVLLLLTFCHLGTLPAHYAEPTVWQWSNELTSRNALHRMKGARAGSLSLDPFVGGCGLNIGTFYLTRACDVRFGSICEIVHHSGMSALAPTPELLSWC